MPIDIDPETIHVDELPGIWSPVQWELDEKERANELENQATASLLWSVDTPEAILRLLLAETAITRAYGPPESYNEEAQGEWDDDLLTFKFKRPIRLVHEEREQNYLYVEYDFYELGRWAIEIETNVVNISRL